MLDGNNQEMAAQKEGLRHSRGPFKVLRDILRKAGQWAPGSP